MTSPGLDGIIEVEIAGDSRDLENHLRAIYDAFSDDNVANKLLREFVTPMMQKRIEDRFTSEGDEMSGQWAPLSEATVAIRESKGFPGSHPINVRTGAMEKVLVDNEPRIETHSLGATMWLPGNVDNEVAKKIAMAQQGDSRTPARPVLGLAAADLELVMVATKQYLEEHAEELLQL